MEQYSLKEEILELFHRGVHLLHRSRPHWRRHGKRPPLPPAQDRLMRLLSAAGRVTQRSLGEMLDIRSASLSELLGKLERPGWISRQPNETDKRTIDIKLTEEGENMLNSIGNERADMAEEVFGALNEEELRQLHSLLGKLIDDWETRFEDEGEGGRSGRRERGAGRPEGGPGWLERVRGHFRHQAGHECHGHHGHHGHHDHHGHHSHEGEGHGEGRGGRQACCRHHHHDHHRPDRSSHPGRHPAGRQDHRPGSDGREEGAARPAPPEASDD